MNRRDLQNFLKQENWEVAPFGLDQIQIKNGDTVITLNGNGSGKLFKNHWMTMMFTIDCPSEVIYVAARSLLKADPLAFHEPLPRPSSGSDKLDSP